MARVASSTSLRTIQSLPPTPLEVTSIRPCEANLLISVSIDLVDFKDTLVYLALTQVEKISISSEPVNVSGCTSSASDTLNSPSCNALTVIICLLF